MWSPCVIDEDRRFVYRLVDPFAEGKALFSFFCEAFGRQFDYAEYEWYKLRHPCSRNRVYVAQEKAGGRFASAVCMMPFRYRVLEEIMTGSLCTGVVTHPDFREMGLFVKINKLLREHESRVGSAFGLGFPNDQALTGHLKADWTMPLSLTFFENRAFDPAPSPAATVERFDAGWDEFCLQASAQFDFCQVKDHQILNWRYKDRPGASYTCLAVMNEQPEALLVLKKFAADGVRKAHIVEFLSLDEDASHALIDAAKAYAAGSELINLWMPPNCAYEEVFRLHGFRPTSERSPVVIRSHDASPLPVFHSPWLVLGDNDVY